MVFDNEFSERAAEGDTVCMNVTITDDNLIEDTTMVGPFTLEVANGNDAVGDTVTHVILITDNDGRKEIHMVVYLFVTLV